MLETVVGRAFRRGERLSALAAPVSTAFPGPGSVESVANDVSGTDFAPQRTCGIETSAILHFGSALTMRELCLQNSGSNSSTRTGYAAATNTSWRKHLGSRNYVAAEAHFETVLETAPTALAALLPLAQMYFDLGEMESSRSLYERIVELAPEHRDGLLGLAQSLGYLGEHGRAIEKLNRMIELGALYLGEAHYWLAWNHYQRDLPDVARENTEKAKRYQPMDAPTFFLSGAIAATTGALDRAEVEFKQALRYDPEHCEAAVELANVYRATARDRDAANQFETGGLCFAERALKARAAVEELIADTVTPSALLQSQTDRYEKQIQDALRERARIHLEAATIYLRLGDLASATRCAHIAATHLDFEERARAVVSRVSR